MEVERSDSMSIRGVPELNGVVIRAFNSEENEFRINVRGQENARLIASSENRSGHNKREKSTTFEARNAARETSHRILRRWRLE